MYKLYLTQVNPDFPLSSIKAIRAAALIGLKDAKTAYDAIKRPFNAGIYPDRAWNSIGQYSLGEFVTYDEAIAALAKLKNGAYCDGRIELPAGADIPEAEQPLTRDQILDMVVDAVVLARSNPELPPSQILKIVQK